MESLVEFRNLSCERDGQLVFAGLSGRLASGDILQVSGVNGSGKTTLLGVLNTALTATAGEVLWRGQPISREPSRYRQNILFIGHQAGLKLSLTPRENLAWLGCLYGVRGDCGVDDALALAGLAGFGDTPCQSLSAGQLRRVALARLRLSVAPVWLLDEPLTAIDAVGVIALEALFSEHAASGGAVLLTTHQDIRLAGVKRLELGGARSHVH
ncbi:MAG: cytochrome c biogenesis heme-transporting ATPase CcmA [Porticoccaceae bacterium]